MVKDTSVWIKGIRLMYELADFMSNYQVFHWLHTTTPSQRDYNLFDDSPPPDGMNASRD